MTALIVLVVVWIVAGSIGFFIHTRQRLASSWREAVLKYPVLIIESDDWGVGPPSDADALQQLSQMLMQFSDRSGRHPVMTLGVILAQPDRRKIAAEPGLYHRSILTEERYAAIRDVMKAGEAAGVFSPQLHGMEHYWPAAVMRAAEHDKDVAAWLDDVSDPPPAQLPDALQSRWIDASGEPIRQHPPADIRDAVEEEVRLFRAAFGSAATVVVPPTFVWNRQVEQAWADQGVATVVTPGARYISRTPDAGLVADLTLIYNGQRGAGEILYLVRDTYFEPLFGHHVDGAMALMNRKTELGRPTLVESHRFNYVGRDAAASIASLESLVRTVLQAFPQVIFVSTSQLARIYRDADPEFIVTALATRLHVCIRRFLADRGIRKKALLSGAMIPVLMLLAPVEIAHGINKRVR